MSFKRELSCNHKELIFRFCRCLKSARTHHGSFVRLATWMMAMAWAVSPSHALDPGEKARLEQELQDASLHLADVCGTAWKYDNLRPTTKRAVAPLGTLFQPPDVPVVHLSPGCPDYEMIVGEMVYWFSLCGSKKKRLMEIDAKEKNDQPGGKDREQHAIKAKVAEKVGKAYDAEGLLTEIYRAENELDRTIASYGRACAWAWPFANLRPLCNQPGFEPATIINPYIPVPTIQLSEASPDYKTIVVSLDHWGSRIPIAKARLKDILDDQKDAEKAAEAVVAAEQNGKLLDENKLSEESRLGQMSKIYQKMKPAVKQWRINQRELDDLSEPWYVTKSTLVMLQVRVCFIQNRIATLNAAAENPKSDRVKIQAEIRDLQEELLRLMPFIAKAQQELAVLESKIQRLQSGQATVTGQIDSMMENWVHLCDIFGRTGSLQHQKAISLFDQWVANEPRLWQVYLARGVAHLHAGQHDRAIDDLVRVGNKMRLYNTHPRVRAMITAVQAYALCKQGNMREGDRWFTEAKNQDKKYWVIPLIRGWSYLERNKYSAAKADFQMAIQLSKNTPQAEVYEVMALLLAACRNDSVRNGEKAVQYAAKACDLTKNQDWICLDTLAAAHAEAGDFDSSLKWANRALKFTPAENQEQIRERIEFYQEKKPYRLK